MIYITVINNVLRRLRERQVSSVNQTTYSSMVGDFVNDAKSQVEAAWQWGANRQILTITTSDGVSEYTLTGAGEKGQILDAYNSTSRRQVVPYKQGWFDRQNYASEVISGSPYRYTYRGEDDSDDPTLELWPTPDGVYSLPFNCYVPQADLIAWADSMRIPSRPVILLATAMLAEEKGEAGGSTSARYFEMADKALADSIMIDESRYPLETDWYEV